MSCNAGGIDHWMAVKNQELFMSRVASQFGALDPPSLPELRRDEPRGIETTGRDRGRVRASATPNALGAIGVCGQAELTDMSRR